MRTALKACQRKYVLALMALASTVSGFGATLYQVALPTSGVNASSGRSNIDWLNCGNYDSPCTAGGGSTGAVGAGGPIYGDAFTLAAGNNYLITSITVYAVDNIPGNSSLSASAAASAFAAEFNSINLYFGQFEDANNPGSYPCTAVDGGVGNCTFNSVASDPTIAQVGYTSAGACASNSGYLASDGSTCLNIYSVTFSGLNILVGPGSYEFAVDAGVNVTTGCAGSLCGWYNLASTNSAANTVTPGSIWGWDGGDLTGGSVSAASDGTNMDALIQGTILTPEPGSFLLSGFGIAAVAFAVLRRRRTNRNSAC